MTRSLPAAVLFDNDPRSADVANTVPAHAEVQRVGDCIVGYSKLPTPIGGAPSAPQRFTIIEMTGLYYRKALRSLVIHRRENGVVIEDIASWAAIAADIAAAVFGPKMTLRNVEGQASYLRLDIASAALAPFALRAAAWRRSPDYKPLSGDEVGRMVQLDWRERDHLEITRIGSFNETTRERRRRSDRERQRGLRERAGARPRSAPKPWDLIGMKRSTYYARNLHLDDFVRISLQDGKADETVQNPGKADEIVQGFGLVPGTDADPMGNADESVQRRVK